MGKLRMLRSVVLAGAVASTAAFAPMPALAPRLRTAQPANVQMAMQPEGKVSRAGFLVGLATAAVLAGGTCRGCFDQFPDGNEFGLFLSPHRQPEGLQVYGHHGEPLHVAAGENGQS